MSDDEDDQDLSQSQSQSEQYGNLVQYDVEEGNLKDLNSVDQQLVQEVDKKGKDQKDNNQNAQIQQSSQLKEQIQKSQVNEQIQSKSNDLQYDLKALWNKTLNQKFDYSDSFVIRNKIQMILKNIGFSKQKDLKLKGIEQIKIGLSQLQDHIIEEDLIKFKSQIDVLEQMIKDNKDNSTELSKINEFKQKLREKVKRKELRLCKEVITFFLDRSKQNTENNIETLGYIYGYEEQNELYGLSCVLYKQKGKSDMCELEEGDTFVQEIADKNQNLIAWIHTHPQHDQFLSSIDLHSQYRIQKDSSAQQNLFALVYSPIQKDPSQRLIAYRLNERGMREIEECEKKDFQNREKHHESHQNNFLNIVEKYTENQFYFDQTTVRQEHIILKDLR